MLQVREDEAPRSPDLAIGRVTVRAEGSRAVCREAGTSGVKKAWKVTGWQQKGGCWDPTSGCLSEGNENRILRRHLHPQVPSSVIHSSQDGDTT